MSGAANRLCAVLGRGLVAIDGPVVHADDLGVTRGDGCFEGMRIRRRGTAWAIDEMEAHLARMQRSADLLEIEFEAGEWRELITLIAGNWADDHGGGHEASLKLVLTRGREGLGGYTGFATVSPVAESSLLARRDGVRVCVLRRGVSSEAYEEAPWLLGGVKLLSYAINMAAMREARARGDDDAIFVSSDGCLLESPTAAIVWVDDGELKTVRPGANGILNSITAGSLLRRAHSIGLYPRWTSGTLADLHSAEAVMLVSSVRGPVRVTHLDSSPLAVSPAGLRIVDLAQEALGFAAPPS